MWPSVGEPAFDAEQDPGEVARFVTSAVLASDFRFPALPAVAAEVMRLANASEVSFREVDAIVRRDPILAARVLAVANSPVYTPKPNVVSLRRSMMILGWQTLRDILWQVIAEAHVFRGGSRQALRNMRTHAVAVAQIAQCLARELSVDPEQAFACGLLHDLGRPLAYEVLRRQPEFRSARSQPRALIDAVHTAVGEQVALAWNLPASLADVMRCHHNPDTAPRPESGPAMAELIAVAERLAKRHGLGTTTPVAVANDAAVATQLTQLGCDRHGLETILSGVEALRAKLL